MGPHRVGIKPLSVCVCAPALEFGHLCHPSTGIHPLKTACASGFDTKF